MKMISHSRPSLDEYFFSLAKEISKRSTCLRRHVGALIIRDGNIISTGYNGPPVGMSHCVTCSREGIPSGQRSELCRAAHAEQNAINFAAKHGNAVQGATMYTTHFPCSWCAKSILNSGIIVVKFLFDYPDAMAREILSHITVEQYKD